MKNSIIDTYTNDIYEYDLIVSKNSDLVELQELYTYSDGSPLDDRILQGSCTTSTIARKSDKTLCCLVKFNCYGTPSKTIGKKLWLVNTVAHEAFHYTMDLWRSLGDNIDYDQQEGPAYLVGWATGCIYKTLSKTK